MSTGAEVELVRVLGRTEVVRTDGQRIDIPSASQRRLLSALALHAPGAVRSGFLCQVLDVSPGALRTSVARLRRVVGDAALETAAGGYRLLLPVDAAEMCDEIDRVGDDPEPLARALERWTGPALEEFRNEGWAVGEAQRLDEVHADAIEDLAELRIVRGDPGRAVQDLQRHIAEHPFRDRPRALLLRALAASGRRTEALRAYQDYRRRLAEDVGTEPGELVRAVERRIAAGWDGVDDRWSADAPADEPPPLVVVDDALSATASGVGRGSVLEQLVDAVERTGTDGTGTFVVAGEVGIGKTTVVAELARTLADERGWRVHYGRCDELAAGPFQPFPSLVGRLVDELPDLDLVAHAAAHGGDVLRLVPTHADRIGAPPAETADERTARHLLFEAVVDVVERSAGDEPTVLVVDDVQWAQPAALHLLRYLAHEMGPTPVLLVLVVRDTGDPLRPEVRDALADLARGRFHRVDLPGLDREGLIELVHRRVPATVGHDVGVIADALWHETAGNALFADQLLAHWNADGRLAVTNSTVDLDPPATDDVPATVRDLVWHRVAMLGDQAESTLTAAAVLGLQFDERVLAAMADVDVDALPALLDRAVAAGVLADHPAHAGTVRFSHALVARALEADLTPRARARLHAQAFEATRSTGRPSDDLAPRLAVHARAGGMDAEALDWAIAAGDRALADLAPEDAAAWFETALIDVATLGRPDVERADLLVRLGEARSGAGDAPAALDAFREAAHLAARGDAIDALVRAALAVDRGTVAFGQSAFERLEVVELAYERRDQLDTATQAQLAGLVAKELLSTAEDDRRAALADEALALARDCDDPAVFAVVAAHVMNALSPPGNAQRRAALAREAVQAVDELEDPRLIYTIFLAAFLAATAASEPDEADIYLHRLRAVATEVGEPEMRWSVGIFDAFRATVAGDFDEAERIIAETVELGVAAGVHEAIPWFAGQTYFVCTYAGRHAEVLPILEQGIEAESGIESPMRLGHAIVSCEIGRPDVAADLLDQVLRDDVLPSIPATVRGTALLGCVVLALELDDRSAAEELLPQILPFRHEVGFSGLSSHGPISAYVGKLESLLGRYAEAEANLREALAATERLGWQYHRATTLFALAQNRFRAEGALDDEAAAWLRDAGALCERHGMASWAKRVDALRALVPA